MPFIRVTFVETQIQVGNIYRVTHLLYIYIIYTHASIYICICYIRGVIESATIYILCFGAIFLFWKNFSHRFNKIIGKAPFFSTYNKFCKFYWKYYYCNTISNFFFFKYTGCKIYLFIYFFFRSNHPDDFISKPSTSHQCSDSQLVHSSSYNEEKLFEDIYSSKQVCVCTLLIVAFEDCNIRVIQNHNKMIN